MGDSLPTEIQSWLGKERYHEESEFSVERGYVWTTCSSVENGNVTATSIVLGAMAARDWRPMHHDHDLAVNRNGVQDIFLNTPNQAAWFERYLTDWTGPKGRLGRIKFRTKNSVFPGDTMIFRGRIEGTSTDESDCGWVDVSVNLAVGDRTVTDCTARIAVPRDTDDNPWSRRVKIGGLEARIVHSIKRPNPYPTGG